MGYMEIDRFVRLFVRRERRERLLYELTNPKKRSAGLDRFCHQSESLLEPKRILMRGDDLERRAEFRAFLAKHGEPCLLLSPGAAPEELPAEQAVALAAVRCDAALILGDGFAVVIGEATKGGRGKYLLSVSY